ncbi:MAG: class I SAM-dependent methyltransferase [Verrucomicrobiales bacterium]|nr:class I SAM-dependent methyltransferase [Verrucomicrobiales bacterium]
MSSVDARTEIFRSSWSLYDAIIGMNYMFHREIESTVGQVIRGIGERGDYSVLDLGCGNARGLSNPLRAMPPRRYVGVDLSRPALDQAAEELKALPSVDLREQDMLASVEELGGQSRAFDLIHSAFAMHHLSASDKARLFRAMSRMLTSAGISLLVDVVRDVGQSREAYLADYLGMVDAEWTRLSAEQIGQVRDHVSAFDYPETLEALVRMARDAGFEEARTLARHRQHHVILFQRRRGGTE